MLLLERLEKAMESEPSYFRTQLLREDVNRVKRLSELAAATHDVAAFKKQGTMIGWTPGDTRSFELKPTLEPFLEEFYRSAKSSEPGNEGHLMAAWDAFDRHRIDLLVGCLARVPLPPRD